ncbi:MAG: hypothetical protein Q8Q18_00060 [bacterium]|nr:hypothetical protein [bacterium]
MYSESSEDYKIPLWESINESVRTQIRVAVKDFTENNPEEKEIEDEIIEKALLREMYFVNEIQSTVNEIGSSEYRNNSKVILFDIDETIGVYNHKTKSTTLRPSLSPVLNYLQEESFKIGIYSSRAKQSLLAQLGDSNQLQSIARYIDTDLVFSSREEKMPMYTTSSDQGFEQLLIEYGDNKHILNRESIMKDKQVFFTQGDLTKIVGLSKIKEQLQDVAIISVDDFLFPQYLDRAHGLFGIALGKKDGSFHNF